MQRDKMLAGELAVGMVVHLYPKTLLELGAKPTGPGDRWVTGHHFSICIEAGPKRCVMLPFIPTTALVEVKLACKAEAAMRNGRSASTTTIRFKLGPQAEWRLQERRWPPGI